MVYLSMSKTKEYQKGDVTVVWKPEICIHSGNCVRALPTVFKPKERPWIQVEDTSEDALIKAIEKCPSGALTYYLKDESTEKVTEHITKAEVIENGPVLIYGTLEVTHTDGRTEKKERSTAFCRCGRTGNNPFCDGSHKNS